MAVSAARVAGRRVANGVFVGFCCLVTAIALVALGAHPLVAGRAKGIGGLNLDVFTMSTPAAGSPGGLRQRHRRLDACCAAWPW